MAYTKSKKKPHIETAAERAWIDEKLNASKKWKKTYKGEIIYTRDGCKQDFSRKAGYNTKEELLEDAKNIIDQMNTIDNSHSWKLISAKLIGQAIDDEKED